MSESNKDEIVIKLNNSREACSLGRDEIIQQKALERFEKLIGQILDRIRNVKDVSKGADPHNRVRTHDAITIDGRRGSGKTTFILSAWNALKDETKGRVCFLGILDPTLIETREHIFVTIISLIKDQVDKKHESMNLSPRDEEKFQAWQCELRNLATGLTLLDGVGTNPMKNESWVDEHLALEWGLKRVRGGNDLELSFHKYVEQSLKFLGKEAFLLAFDDIDTDFSKGWPVLEILRKYLTTPRFITVLSGDLRLYTTLVQKKQWKNIGFALSSPREARQSYENMVDELVDQYLLKILKVSSRIELRSVWYYVNNHTPGVDVKMPCGEQKDLKAFLQEEVCKDILCIPKLYTEDSVRLFLDLEPRSLVSVLSGIEQYRKSDNPEPRASSIQAIGDVFLYWLDRMGYRRQDIEEDNAFNALKKLSKALYDRDLFPEGAALRPCLFDSGTNKALLLLGGYIADIMSREPAAYFDYMLRVGLTANVFREISSYTHLDSDGKSKSVEDKKRAYVKHVGVYEESRSKGLAGRYLSFMHVAPFVANSGVPVVKQGTVQIYSDRSVSGCSGRDTFEESTSKYTIRGVEDFVSHKERFNTCETLSSNIKSWHKALLAMLLSKNGKNDGSSRYLSFFNLVGAIGEILRARDVGELRDILSKLCLVKTFPVFATAQASNQSEAETVDSDDLSFDVEEIDKEFLEKLMEWKRSFSETDTSFVHPVVIYKAWSRFYYALEMPQKDAKNRLAGNLVHRWIVLFLNAFLVEESVANNTKCKLSQNNPTNSDEIFKKNVGRFLNKPQCLLQIPFTRWLFSCPLWQLYLYPDIAKEVHKISSSKNNPLDIIFDVDVKYEGLEKSVSLHDCLNSLAVFGLPKTKQGVQNDSDRKKTTKEKYEELLQAMKGNTERLEVIIDGVYKNHSRSINDDEYLEIIKQFGEWCEENNILENAVKPVTSSAKAATEVIAYIKGSAKSPQNSK